MFLGKIEDIPPEIIVSPTEILAFFEISPNPREDEVVNMFEAGIIDPTKVTRLALENAASVAGTLLITEAVVSKNKDDKNDKPAGIDPSMLLG